MHLFCESGRDKEIRLSGLFESVRTTNLTFGVIAMQDISLSYKFASLVSASPTLYLRYGI